MAPKRKAKTELLTTQGRLTHFFHGSNTENINAEHGTKAGTSATTIPTSTSSKCHQQLSFEEQGHGDSILSSNSESAQVASGSFKDVIEEEKSNDQKNKKRKKGQWAIGRAFQADWVSKYPCILPAKTSNGEPPIAASCLACSWKLGREVMLQLKIDTIEKHVGKVYEEQEVDGKVTIIVRWKSAEECHHVRYLTLYEAHLQQIEVNKRAGESIRRLFDEKAIKDGESTMVQFVLVLHILSMGKPMADYPKWKAPLNFIGLRVPTFLVQYWNEPTGWEFANFMSEIVKGNLQKKILESTFISISLDEVTARDTTSWVCMNVYFVEKHKRQVMYVGIFKLKSTATAEILLNLVIECLTRCGAMSLEDICKKIVCVGVDGCSVMHGNRTGLCVQLQTSYCPYMMGIHCMAHRTNLAYKILKEFDAVQKVEDLVRKSYNFFSKSPKRRNYFTMFAEGITEGKKLLKHIDTRWISLIGLVERLFEEYKSVLGTVYELANKKDKGQAKAKELLELLTDVETFLYLGGLLPMLREMNLLIKVAQMRDFYVMEYTTARKMACLSLESLYNEVSDLKSEEFKEWKSSIDVGSQGSCLKYDSHGCLCMDVKGKLIKLHVMRTMKKVKKIKNVKQSNFEELISYMKKELVSICITLTREIRDRFSRDELLESMAVVHPLYWNNSKNKQSLFTDFSSKINVLAQHFGRQINLKGLQVDGLINSKELVHQSALLERLCGSSTMV